MRGLSQHRKRASFESNGSQGVQGECRNLPGLSYEIQQPRVRIRLVLGEDQTLIKMTELSVLLPKALRQLPPTNELMEKLVISVWERAVGETMEQRTRPFRLY